MKNSNLTERRNFDKAVPEFNGKPEHFEVFKRDLERFLELEPGYAEYLGTVERVAGESSVKEFPAERLGTTGLSPERLREIDNQLFRILYGRLKNQSGHLTKLTTYTSKGEARAAKLWFALLRHYQGANEQRLQLVLQRVPAGKRTTSLSELEAKLDQFDHDLFQFEGALEPGPQGHAELPPHICVQKHFASQPSVFRRKA